ncbi:hypothetical protein [uncultured Fibrobacter sp.]|uniref:hypothetical protein n=1 Tax=uncultured Fibrobacter sp. TaxID=261512 RepID=UPI002804B0B1|nr:hypothetical protein [uncultured Fibrobacter sp.]
MKLQESYYAETAKVGSWDDIGYKLSGTAGTGDEVSTPNFKFSSAAPTNEDGSKTAALVAESLVGLNDCAKGSEWTVTVSEVTGALQTVASISGSGCDVLTPNFKQLSYNGQLGGSAAAGE